jgi:hypothetical protein
LIIQAIRNLGIDIKEMEKEYKVTDHYNIQESTQMQMRRYLTSINEINNKILFILEERNRIEDTMRMQNSKLN